MTDITVVPASLTLVVGETTYVINSADIAYTAAGINTCTCVIAVGVGRDGAPVNPDAIFVRNTPATLYASAVPYSTSGDVDTLPPESFTVFTGYVDVGGPAQLSYGSFSMFVRLYGRLAKLDNGTLQSNVLIPSAYSDDSAIIGEIVSAGVGDDVDIAKYGEALVNVLVRIASGDGLDDPNALGETIHGELADMFGASANLEAASLLSSIGHRLNLREDLVDAHSPVLREITENIVGESHRLSSFYQKLVLLGQQLWFRVIELPGSIYLVPFNPLFPASFARTIVPTSYSAVSWNTAGMTNYAGCALVAKGLSIPLDPKDLVVGLYHRGGFGRVLTESAPWICQVAGESEGSALFAAVEQDRKMPSFSGLTRNFGDRMAKQLCLEQVYSARQMQVGVPYFRVDIGPLSAVRVQYPDVAGQLGGEVYGQVQQVRISLNATSRSASTTYDIGYIRSASEQYAELDSDVETDPEGETSGISHPIWDWNFYGTRLDRFSGESA